jgi:hypothetical protein
MNVRITADTSKLRVPFSLRGLDGHIDVSLTRNTDPDSLGYSLLSGGEPVDFARDFPVCRGHRHLCGTFVPIGRAGLLVG